MTRPMNMRRCVYPVPLNVQEFMSKPMAEVVLLFEDPTEALVRLITCSPLGTDEENLALYAEDSEYLDDFCNGGRWHRVQKALPKGAAALTGVLFLDELNQDKKGFSTGEGAIIVGGNFRRDARESTYAKASIATFPSVDFPGVIP
jgi:hypothetical protein